MNIEVSVEALFKFLNNTYSNLTIIEEEVAKFPDEIISDELHDALTDALDDVGDQIVILPAEIIKDWEPRVDIDDDIPNSEKN